MTLELNKVTLGVNGVLFEGWQSVTIERSIEQASARFDCAYKQPGLAVQRLNGITPGSLCVVRIDFDVVVTGYVDVVQVANDSKDVTFSATGRSKTADAIDCSADHPIGRWRNVSLHEIAQTLLIPYGIGLVTDAPIGIVTEFAIEDGETVYSALSRLAQLQSLLVTEDASGNVVLTQTGLEHAYSALVTGHNILTSRFVGDVSGVFSTYTCRGQSVLSDTTPAASGVSVTGIATYDGVSRYRNKTIRADKAITLESAQKFARWEASTRAGASVDYECVIHGWRQENGRLWRVNQVVTVNDTICGIMGEFLITSVTHTISLDGGLRTTLRCAPLATYQPFEPTVERFHRGVAVFGAELG